MDINDIRKIGQKLKKEIPAHVHDLGHGASLGRGAGGDTTHPIDRLAEDIVIEELEKLNKPVTLVSEECGVRDFSGGGPRILLDPIDGSRNAISGVPMFSTSIALVDGDLIGDIIAGYVLNIPSGDEYWSVKEKGSFLNGRQIKTQQDDTCKIIAYEAQVPRRDIPAIMPFFSLFSRTRCFGSTALDMAFVAAGAVSVFIVPSPSRSFDFAAGYLLIQEAGGIVTDLNGKSIEEVQIGVTRSTPLLASANEDLHKKALGILQDND